MTFSIQLLKMGQCDVMGPEVFWMSHWNDWVQLYFWMAVIRGNGKTAIINTGPPDDLTGLNERWSGGFGERGKLARQESERPLNALATLGIKPEDVDYVLITPIQIYATANIQLFSNAQICISKRGWIEDFHAEKFPMHVPREFRLSDETLRYLTFEGHERLRLVGRRRRNHAWPEVFLGRYTPSLFNVLRHRYGQRTSRSVRLPFQIRQP